MVDVKEAVNRVFREMYGDDYQPPTPPIPTEEQRAEHRRLTTGGPKFNYKTGYDFYTEENTEQDLRCSRAYGGIKTALVTDGVKNIWLKMAIKDLFLLMTPESKEKARSEPGFELLGIEGDDTNV